MANTPNHLEPENCYVCGYRKGQHTDADRHSFWSNADAATDFAKEPQADTNAEARYVEDYRPY